MSELFDSQRMSRSPTLWWLFLGLAHVEPFQDPLMSGLFLPHHMSRSPTPWCLTLVHMAMASYPPMAVIFRIRSCRASLGPAHVGTLVFAPHEPEPDTLVAVTSENCHGIGPAHGGPP